MHWMTAMLRYTFDTELTQLNAELMLEKLKGVARAKVAEAFDSSGNFVHDRRAIGIESRRRRPLSRSEFAIGGVVEYAIRALDFGCRRRRCRRLGCRPARREGQPPRCGAPATATTPTRPPAQSLNGPAS
jgi:hypothetical protein